MTSANQNLAMPDDELYLTAKAAQPEAILFRLNDKAFEAYGDDATIVARVRNVAIIENPQGIKCVAFDSMSFVDVKLDLEERGFGVGMVSGGAPCPAIIDHAPIYPKQCFIQLGFGDMPTYTPTECVWNDPLEMYCNFISDDRTTLEADIEDTKEEYKAQIEAGDRDKDDVPEPEYVSACTLFADGSIQIGDRVVTMQNIFEHFGMDETDGVTRQ